MNTCYTKNPDPKAQARAYAELLDVLGVGKVYVLGTSAGGTVAIRFALDYPDRTEGLILYSSASPLTEKPETYKDYQGPQEFLNNDFAMWLFRPLFQPLMGMESDTVYSMLPLGERRAGMKIDATVTNIDMARNFERYPIEELQVPALIIAAKDDKLSDFNAMEKVVPRFPECTFISFESGGHLLVGHEDEIQEELDAFIDF